MKKCLGLSMLIVGTIIGAGFSSGREIVAFFGKDVSYWIVPVVGLCFFLLSTLLFFVGNLLKKPNISEINAVFWGKFHFFADTFLLLNSLIILAGMLSAMDTLLGYVYQIKSFYSIISGIMCAILVSKGLRTILRCNILVVPLIIAILVIVCFFNIPAIGNPSPFSSFSLGAAIIYVSMNMMLASTFFITIHDLKKSTIICGSAIASVILSVLLFLLITAINKNSVYDSPMPVLELAARMDKSLLYLGIVVIAMSIFTTMMTSMNTLKLWVQGFGGGDVWNISVVLISGLIVSNLGFENLVGYIYPVIGVFGIVYIAVILIYLFKFKKLQKSSFAKSASI